MKKRSPKRPAKYWVLKRKELYIGGYSLSALFLDARGVRSMQLGWGAGFAFKQSEAERFYDIKLLREVMKGVNLSYPSMYGPLRIVKVV